jgi:nicotinate-nucleotide pyrophosphorylase (carboxylating)
MMKKIAAGKPPYMPLEVEVRTMNELREVLSNGTPNIVMLDNMNDEQLKAAITYIKTNHPPLMIEVSGGITMDRFERLRSVGVENVSIGALTTMAQNVDISFSISTSNTQ